MCNDIYIYIAYITTICSYIDNHRFKDIVSCTLASCSYLEMLVYKPWLYIVVYFFAIHVGTYYPAKPQDYQSFAIGYPPRMSNLQTDNPRANLAFIAFKKVTKIVLSHTRWFILIRK